MLDDDEDMIMARARLAAMQARKKPRNLNEQIQSLGKEIKRIFNRGPRTYTGERLIHINNQSMNYSSKFSNNSVSTSKYNVITFLPKFLAEQFSKYANIFFLFTACIQQIPNVSPTNRYTTILPLSLVLLVAMMKEFQEDLVRSSSFLYCAV